LHVVAEGIEQESEKEFLVACGCDLLQGYLLGHPEPPEAITKLLRMQSESHHGTEHIDPSFRGQLRINLSAA
jgi:EAL domain-containing protein (putative c-di-GMP-specific phosphodiesterase class I)